MPKPYVPPLVRSLLLKLVAEVSVTLLDPIKEEETASAIRYIVRAVEAYGRDYDSR